MSGQVLRRTARHPVSAALGAAAGLAELAGWPRVRGAAYRLARCRGCAADWFDFVADLPMRQQGLASYVRDTLWED